MTEQQQLIAMLSRAGIGHGIRQDWKDGKPNGQSVQVETDHDPGFWVTEFGFDEGGKLVEVVSYEGEEG